jgi:hypothetical protein
MPRSTTLTLMPGGFHASLPKGHIVCGNGISPDASPIAHTNFVPPASIPPTIALILIIKDIDFGLIGINNGCPDGK